MSWSIRGLLRPLSLKWHFLQKLIEYLGTGKPVVCTDLTVLDGNLRRHLVIVLKDLPEELIRCFDEVSFWDDAQREQWHVETMKFVQDEFSPATQGKKILDFIASLTRTDQHKRKSSVLQ